MVSQVGERAVACLWPEIVADRSFVLVEQHAAGGTFQQLEDSGARTHRGRPRSLVALVATAEIIFDRSTWPSPCEVRWRYSAAVSGNATWACAARNADSVSLAPGLRHGECTSFWGTSRVWRGPRP